jgi:hypothetical protein
MKTDEEYEQEIEVRHIPAKVRDRFAAAALVGLLSRGTDTSPSEGYATLAYRYADAMLEARKK